MDSYLVQFFLFICFIFCPASIVAPAASISSDLVDYIDGIDVGSRQLVISTTKQGPLDNAKVEIWTVDIETGEKLLAVNLTGILLILARGEFQKNMSNLPCSLERFHIEKYSLIMNVWVGGSMGDPNFWLYNLNVNFLFLDENHSMI